VQPVALSEIVSIGDRITAQQGGASGTPYYDIELTLRSGKKLTLGHTLRDQHEAAWLVEEMSRLTLDVVGRTLVGTDFSGQGKAASTSP